MLVVMNGGGRVTLPQKICQKLNIRKGQDGMSLFLEDRSIVMEVFREGDGYCYFCGGGNKEMKILKGKNVCKRCANALKNAFKREDI